MRKIAHICFGPSANGILKMANKNDLIPSGTIISLYDDLSYGPLNDLYSTVVRVPWLKELNIKESYYAEEITKNFCEFQTVISELNEDYDIYIWYGENGREVCGLMFTLELLKSNINNVYLINIHKKIIRRGYNVFFYKSVSEIPYDHLSEFMDITRKLNLDEYNALLHNFEIVKKDPHFLRLYKNGEIVCENEDYFDIDILKYTDSDFIKSSYVVGNVLGNSEHLLDDNFVFYRIRKLTLTDKIEFQGEIGSMRKLQIRITEEGLKLLNNYPAALKTWNKTIKAKNFKEMMTEALINKGRIEERRSIAKNLLDVLDTETIAKKTGLTLEEVKSLQE